MVAKNPFHLSDSFHAVHAIEDVQTFARSFTSSAEKDAYHFIDLGTLARRVLLWRKYLPLVSPHYAIKTNHDAMMVAELNKLGLGFDCASMREVEQIASLGVAPERIIFANPIRSVRTINALKAAGISNIVFDSQDELQKIVDYFPTANLVIRIATHDTHSVVRLSKKFGASLKQAYELLHYAAHNKLNVKGVSFHVGSNCDFPPSYRDAIIDAAKIMRHAKNKLGMAMSLLDLGGGWPGTNDEAFIKIAQMVDETIAEFIPGGVEIISEPGSFFAGPSMSSAIRVIGQKLRQQSGEWRQDLYLASGTYGLFSVGGYLKCDPAKIARYGWNFQPLSRSANGERLRTTLWGPTCDSTDKIMENYWLPRMSSGEWLFSPNVGSYSFALASDFNQIDHSEAIYVRTGPLLEE